MPQIDDVSATITADASGYNAAMNTLRSSTAGATDSAGAALKTVGDVLELYVISKLVQVGEEAVAQFNEATQAALSLGVQIKATGDSVGWTSDQLAGMAENLSQTSIYGKEDILSGVTDSLLKFHDISGNVFSEAQQDIVDYASVTGKSLSEASATIGRALENPTQSFMLLKRAGIDLVAMGLKPTIDNLMMTGQVGKAQQVILDALSGSFEGMSDKMKATPFGQITSDTNIFKEALIPVGKIVETAMVPLYNVLGNVSRAFMELSPSVQKIIVDVGLFVVGIGTVLPVLGILTTVLPLIGTAAVAAFGTLTTVILPVIVIAAALALAGQVIYDNWRTLKSTAVDVWGWIKTTIESAVTSVIGALEKIPGVASIFNGLKQTATETGSEISSSFNTAGAFISTTFSKPVSEIAGEFQNLTAEVKANLLDIGTSSQETAKIITPPWVVALGDLDTAFQSMAMSVMDGVKTMIEDVATELETGGVDWNQVLGTALQGIIKQMVDFAIAEIGIMDAIAKVMQALQTLGPIATMAAAVAAIAIVSSMHLAPPAMAKGGVFDQATTVTVGEAGPEVILPVTRLSNGKMGVGTTGGSGGGMSVGASGGQSSGASDGGVMVVQVNLDSSPILKAVSKASRTGKLVIHPNAVRIQAVN